MKGKVEYLKIVEQRKFLDMTQKYLSEKSGVDISVIKHLETGRSDGKIEGLKKICNALELNIEDIYNPEFRSTKVITFMINKGGNGKTSMCSSVAFQLQDKNKILLIDADMSMNLTRLFSAQDNEKNLAKAMNDECNILYHINHTEYPNIDIVASDQSLSVIDMILNSKMGNDSIVKCILKGIIDKGIYDYILFDTNPVLSILNYNVLIASHYVVIPIVLEQFAMDGIGTVMTFIDSAQRKIDLKIAGMVINKYDIRQKITNQACEDQLSPYRNLLFETKIRVDAKLGRSQTERIQVDKGSRIHKDYIEFTKELIKRVR